ncbi:MAG: MraY family glycosyltransferase, partial [Acidimicrobiia bacterium]
ALDIPKDRSVHAVPTPTLGGAAMFLGIVGALAAASTLSEFSVSFVPISLIPPTEMVGILIGTTIVFAVGVIDDLKALTVPIRIAGQVVAAGLAFLSGVRLEYFGFPLIGTISLSPDLQAIITIIWIVAICNALNWIDGLDGLAAGITAIAAGTFFFYAYRLATLRLATEVNAPLLCIALLGVTVAFLRFNFNPARIIMGSTGAYQLGFLVAAATAVGVGRASPINPFTESRFILFYLPIAIPLSLLAIPIIDTLAAVVRRARRGQYIFQADKEHLHHRLMEIGHGHRQAVLILYGWTGTIAGAALAASFVQNRLLVVLFLLMAVALFLYTMLPRIVSSELTSQK